jgi:hypothetical protein
MGFSCLYDVTTQNIALFIATAEKRSHVRPEGKPVSERTSRRKEDNIKMDLKEVRLENMEYTHLSQIRIQRMFDYGLSDSILPKKSFTS